MQISGVDPEGARSHLNAPRQDRNPNSQGHTVNKYGRPGINGRLSSNRCISQGVLSPADL